jgi:outer membrane protein assembly factor BamB
MTGAATLSEVLALGVLAAQLVLGPAARIEPGAILLLDAPLDHVQGIDTDGRVLWVTEVNRKARTGHLHEFDLKTGKRLRSVDLTRGSRYHPGGIASDGTFIWVPMAEYRPKSSATILKVRQSDLSAEAAFEIADHIGAVAVDGPAVYAANWDSKQIYILSTKGVQGDSSMEAGGKMQIRNNPTGTSFQDIKFHQGLLVGGGGRGPDAGAIDWLNPRTLELVRRIEAGKTDRGVRFTHEGFAIRGGRIYLLPEDGPSRLFVFPIPE